jgi:hypothetical protein
MNLLIPLDFVVTQATVTLRAALLALTKRLVSGALRAIASGIAFLADLLHSQKNKKRP